MSGVLHGQVTFLTYTLQRRKKIYIKKKMLLQNNKTKNKYIKLIKQTKPLLVSLFYKLS